ncbi:AAA family ATPase [Actinomyces sp. oral taxon 171]|uniref:AAA family ATPase n=1 Tax=Actinomyces sp. oral taxon 171 TaxID=706438 RepID=UPI0001F629D8|nr:hypothetical protein [Actinomyces sp. oral taxon 171]EFW27370.1 hypothetical protein HMPREF9057_01237 [Actinomyces sp. oral taxon 171 str. F0337]QCT33741.1 hypothetical protein FBF36_09960 [Actinomyces sp. oral taxon 171 str. F0337]
MSVPGAGVLLALSGDDADILRVLSQAGSGLCVVRRCADLPELLSAGMAGLATFALLDTGFDEIDRTVLDRLARAGLSGLLLVDDCEEERWRSAGWPVLRRDTDPSRICSVMQDLVRRGAPSGGSSQGTGPASAAVSETVTGPVAVDTDWLSAATPASTGSNAAAQETAWLEELWRQSPGSPGDGMVPSQPSWFSGGAGTGGISGQNRRRGPEPTAMSPADDGRRGRIVLVWGPHGSPGRSTVSASLAHGLAASGGAILVDADVEAPSLVQLLGMPEDSSALAGAARLATHGRLDAESFQRVLAPVGGGLSLLGGLGRSGRWRELPPASMTEVWLQCRRAAAWTVVDVAGGPVDDDVDDFTLEPGRGAVTADLVSHADVILVVGGADPVGVRRLLQLLDEVGSSMSPTGRVEVIINRVRASAAGPSPQHALREALARFGGLEDIVLLPDDAATADACLLRGCAVLEGAPTSALGKALSALVDRIDPQAAAARKARSPRRSLLRRSKKRDGHRDPADQVPSTRGRNRSTARSAGARRRRKGGGGGRAVGERLPAPQAPGGPARTSQQPLQAPPPAIQPVNQPVNHPPGRPQGPSPSRSPIIPPAQSSPPAQSPPPAQGSVPGSPCRPSATPWSGEGRASGAGSSPGAVRGPQAGRAPGGNDDRGSGDPPSVPPGTGRHRY